MASKPVALLLADLGVTKSHSRPHCSNLLSRYISSGVVRSGSTAASGLNVRVVRG
jgi:hypothetical protein